MGEVLIEANEECRVQRRRKRRGRVWGGGVLGVKKVERRM